MKKIIEIGLLASLIFGLVISTTTAQEIQGTQDVVKEQETSEIKELTIRNSGFRSRSTIVIQYRENDKKIVSVTENGKKLPPEEFSRYESVKRIVLELPQIDRLLPEIDRAYRRSESPRISAESKIREMFALRRRLTGMESDVARRYQNITELQLLAALNKFTAQISESSDLSQTEKIAQLRDILEKIQTLEVAQEAEYRQRRLLDMGAANAASKLIAEINKSSDMSKKEKIQEIELLIQQMRPSGIGEEKRRTDLVELEAQEVISQMLDDIANNKELTDGEKEKEIESLIRETEKINSENIKRLVGVEKFKFQLDRLLKQEGLFPEGKSEFVLNSTTCSIDGKRLSKEIHEKILQLCEECIGKEFGNTTKIVLQLNEDR